MQKWRRGEVVFLKPPGGDLQVRGRNETISPCTVTHGPVPQPLAALLPVPVGPCQVSLPPAPGMGKVPLDPALIRACPGRVRSSQASGEQIGSVICSEILFGGKVVLRLLYLC